MKLKKFLREYPLLLLFALVMGGLFLLDLCFTSNPYSELENRKLKQKPVFSLESLVENRYTKEYEEYINDQFVGRDQWITLKSVFESALGKTENNGVVYGADRYIYNKLLDPALGEKRDVLRRCVDRASQEISRGENRARLIDTDAAFVLDGWFPAASEGELTKLLGGFSCAWETADPTPEEYPQVPIKLKNNPVTGPFNVITEMYAMPAYDTVDPNPLMAPFFIIFFGFMMNDIGYGLLMVLGTLFFLMKARPKGSMRDMMTMFFMCGIASTFWGCLTGGFFGDFLPKLFDLIGIAAGVPGYHDASGAFVWFWKPVFTPINDIILVMVGAMAMGVVQVFTGMAVSVEEKFRHGNALDAVTQEIAWWCILIGAAIAIGGPMIPGAPAVLGSVGMGLLILGAVLLLAGNLIRAKGLGGITGFVGDVYNGVSGYFSDILSYLRLMALMMAGSIIASVFNTLGSVFGLVPFIVVAIIGNVLNLVLNLLGCYVHTMRLQCLEFFGRFYQDGGKPFRPLAVETKYVDILKEEI